MTEITYGQATSPSYTDWDSTLTGKMINYTENRDSIGFDKMSQRWYAPNASMGYDPNQRGMGVDINTNQYVKPFLKQDNKGIYLTKEDEKTVRYKSINDAEGSYARRLAYAQQVVKSTKHPSQLKKALTINAIYNLGSGTVAKELFSDKELMNSLLNGTDNEYMEHVIRYFQLHNKKERPQLIRKFVADYQKKKVIKRQPTSLKLIPKQNMR